MVDLRPYKVVVLVFGSPGCPACQEFTPRFRQIAQAYVQCLPEMVQGQPQPRAAGAIFYLDANDPKNAPVADRFNVQYMPTVIVLRKPRGMLRFDGSVPNNKIVEILNAAVQGLSCFVGER
jgi:thiol-disulfide isomerase/thioredoxin